MRKKGFTLIELLAVIVILAIIAIVTIPLVSNVIASAREAAFLDTAYGLIKASENEYMDNVLKGNKPTDIKINYPQDKNRLKVKGKMPDSGEILITSSGEIAVGLWSDAVGKCAVKNFDEVKVRYDEDIEDKEDCTVIGLTGKIVEMWDGWITLSLYYPPNSTERQWRLSSPGEVRTEGIFMWQDYTGPITVPLSRVQDIWIKYKLDNKEIIIPPAGVLLVDIVPDSYGSNRVEEVKVKINYDEEATLKEYRVGNSDWIPYTGEFIVTENAMIEARAKKTEKIYDQNGNLVMSRNKTGRDYVYIGNIGIQESELEAPTIERLEPTNGNEVAKVRITYPGNATRKIYKINYGEEKEYSSEVSIKDYGTHVIAYYYNASGKRSKSVSIYINEGSSHEAPVIYNPLPPINSGDPIPVNPRYVVPAPSIIVNPTTVTTSVQVSVDTPANADKIYLRLGNGNYELYTMPITVTSNMQVSAYYITYDGERSDTGYGRVSNIKQGDKPYLRIDANPYPYSGSYGASSVNVTFDYSDADSVEYSLDGVVYMPYTNSFTVNKNLRVYGRATNQYGVTTSTLDITNIGYYEAPQPKQNLSVTITAVPEPSISNNLTDKVLIKIDYDKKATQKYYSLGKNGKLIEYTEPFELTENTTVYAYALSDNGKGEASKKIDNISSGIAEPIIVANPNNATQTYSTNITIEYDKNAMTKRYSINGGPLRDYGGPFDVTTNGEIYAYSSNSLGQVSEAKYTVSNIMPTPPLFTIDMGDYFILKLNYPAESTGREYKFKENGVWKPYKEEGILLIKPQHKNNLLNGSNELKVKIRNENGELVNFNGDWYILDYGISDISELIFMRWNRSTSPKPQIIPNTIEPASEVEITILYDNSLVRKQYKIVGPDGEIISDYKSYKDKIKVTKNNTLIYARGRDNDEIWTEEAIYKVTNIDEEQPVIKLTMDLETITQRLDIKVSVTDDVEVAKVKWAKGILGESYFKNGGVEIPNNSVVSITENDYYTFYAEDVVGNKQVYTVNVKNIDLTPPIIVINSTPENTVGTEALVTIDFGDSTLKQYKIGNSSTWSNYTAPFTVTSYQVLSSNLQNEDGTVTIYAKGKDNFNNEVIVSKKLVNLDLDMPVAPVISSNAGYPILTISGVILEEATAITYDSRTDINNYYSVDNGVTWLEYTGPIQSLAGTIKAKSVKKDTGLEVIVTQSVGLPTDAIPKAAYDRDNNTYANTMYQYMLVDSSMHGKNMRVKATKGGGWKSNLIFFNSSGQQIGSVDVYGTVDFVTTVPVGTAKFYFSKGNDGTAPNIYEIQPCDEPTFSATNGYPLLHADVTKGIYLSYQMITINYTPSSVQRLYRIGTEGEWLEYQDKPVWVNQGQTIYAKGIDKNGYETRITSSYTVNVVDAVQNVALDGNYDTAHETLGSFYIAVDPSVAGEKIHVKWRTNQSRAYLRFLNANKEEISNVLRDTYGYANTTFDEMIDVPEGTRWIIYEGIKGSCIGCLSYLYEIEVGSSPLFTTTNGYPTLHINPNQAKTSPHQMITINYFKTSVQRLYRIGTEGEWLNYQDQPIQVNQGQTIYAKGIDKYSNETLISSHTPTISDAIPAVVFDGDFSTAMSTLGSYYMVIDPSVQGKKVRVKWKTTYSRARISFLDADKQEISYIEKNTTGVTNRTYDEIYDIPDGARWLMYSGYSGGCGGCQSYLYEIQLVVE